MRTAASAPGAAGHACSASPGDHFSRGRARDRSTSASDVDVVLMRQDPPFDLGYITATHLLERIAGRDAGGQRPARGPQRARKALRARLRALHAADADHPLARTSRAFHASTARSWSSRSTATPARRCSRSARDGTNLAALIELFGTIWREPFMVQAFLPEVAEGDKRIVLVDGEVAGAINRMPGEGEFRSNLAAGGTADGDRADRPRARNLRRAGARAQAARPAVRRHRRDRRQWLTEINVTSPTGIVAIDAVQRHRHAGADLGRDRSQGRRQARPHERLDRPPDRAIGLSRRRLPDVPGDRLSADPVGSDHVGRRGRRGPGQARLLAGSSPRAPPARCSAISSGISPPARSGIQRLEPIIDRWGRWLTMSWAEVKRAERWFARARHVLRLPRPAAADRAQPGLGPRRPAQDELPPLPARLDSRHRRLDRPARRRRLQARRELRAKSTSSSAPRRTRSWSILAVGYVYRRLDPSAHAGRERRACQARHHQPLKVRSRMGVAIDVEQPRRIDLRIDLRRRQAGMAQQFLQRAQDRPRAPADGSRSCGAGRAASGCRAGRAAPAHPAPRAARGRD